MAFVPAPGIVQVSPIITIANQRCQNSFYYQVAGAIDRAKLRAMATTYLMWFTASAGIFTNTAELILIYCRDLTTANSETLDFAPVATTDGTNASPALSNNCTLAIKRESGKAGRSRRGRLYHIGLVQSMLNSSNTLLPSQASNIAVQYNTLMASQLTDNGAVEVILHKKLGTGTPIVEYTVTDNVIDSQRRRLPGHNIHH